MITSLIIVTLIVIFDQITKVLVLNNISLYGSKSVIDKFFYIVHQENTGMGFSMFDDQTVFLAMLSTVMAVVFIYYLRYEMKHNSKIHKLLMISLALIIGGTIGNMIDRWMTVFELRGGVIDFLQFYIFGYDSNPFAVFNVADASLVVGVILLIVEILFRDEKTIKTDSKNKLDSITNDKTTNLKDVDINDDQKSEIETKTTTKNKMENTDAK